MKRIALLSTVFGCFLIISLCSHSALAQTTKGKCTNEVLALNTTPDVLDKTASIKKPCPKTTKRINQSPRATTTDQEFFYYRDVDLDQVTETYINTFPETATHVEATLRSAEQAQGDKEPAQRLSCKNQEKKDCSKKKDIRRVRPSATVKLVKY
ncbi:MAG: hypothetical protein R2824_13985 [Saprospiraceae bacterium]|nr:hypothetical protein [Lewinella sp.]